jgi:hypothetical protein
MPATPRKRKSEEEEPKPEKKMTKKELQAQSRLKAKAYYNSLPEQQSAAAAKQAAKPRKPAPKQDNDDESLPKRARPSPAKADVKAARLESRKHVAARDTLPPVVREHQFEEDSDVSSDEDSGDNGYALESSVESLLISCVLAVFSPVFCLHFRATKPAAALMIPSASVPAAEAARAPAAAQAANPAAETNPGTSLLPHLATHTQVRALANLVETLIEQGQRLEANVAVLIAVHQRDQNLKPAAKRRKKGRENQENQEKPPSDSPVY